MKLLSTDYTYVKFVRHNHRISHRRHVCQLVSYKQHLTHKLYVDPVFMTYPNTKFHTTSSNGLLVTAVKL
jgi:hypothetical protein